MFPLPPDVPPNKLSPRFLVITDFVLYSRFLVKLYLNGVKSPRAFFAAIMQTYIEHDMELDRFLEKTVYPKIRKKGMLQRMNRLRSKVAEEVIGKNLKSNLTKFGLDEKEIENIFDILEKEK
jgi:hypothetical protein